MHIYFFSDLSVLLFFFFFFFNDTATTEIYTLSLHDALPILSGVASFAGLSIDKSGAGYTLTGAATGLTTGTSATFNVTAGEGGQLGVPGQPSDGAGGLAINPAGGGAGQEAPGDTGPGCSGRGTLVTGA